MAARASRCGIASKVLAASDWCSTDLRSRLRASTGSCRWSRAGTPRSMGCSSWWGRRSPPMAFPSSCWSGSRTGSLSRRWCRPAQFQDLGSFLLTFVMLWAYMEFSQFLIIWGGNLTEEIPWYIRRMEGVWGHIGLLLVILSFAFPFFLLLFRHVKRRTRSLLIVALLVLLMRLVDMYWMVLPAFGGGSIHLTWMDVALPLGMGGIWFAYFLWQLQRMPLLPVHDPRMEEIAAQAAGTWINRTTLPQTRRATKRATRMSAGSTIFSWLWASSLVGYRVWCAGECSAIFPRTTWIQPASDSPFADTRQLPLGPQLQVNPREDWLKVPRTAGEVPGDLRLGKSRRRNRCACPSR